MASPGAVPEALPVLEPRRGWGLGLLRALVLAVWATTVTALLVPWRRLLRGPTRSSWSWRYELFANLMRALTPLASITPVVDVRRALDFAGGLSLYAWRVPRCPAPCTEVPCTWFGPDDPSLPVIVYLHGGGYAIGSVRAYRDCLARIARTTRTRVLAVDYRLAPEHPHPRPLQDALAAWRWLLTSGVDRKRVVVAGDSAGGGLTLSLLQALRDRGEPLPGGAVCISPWADLGCQRPSKVANLPYDYLPDDVLRLYAGWYAGRTALDHPLVSPAQGDFRSLPPLLVLVGGAERLCDTGRAVAERATAHGVSAELEVWDDMVHAWPLFAAVLPEAHAALERVGRWVHAQVAPPANAG